MPPTGEKEAVVIDLNILQKQTTSKLSLNPRFEYVIPDVMGPEILDKPYDEVSIFANKISKLFELNHELLSFGLPLGNIFATELRKEKPLFFDRCFDSEFCNSIKAGFFNATQIELTILNGHAVRSNMPKYRRSKQIWTETMIENSIAVNQNEAYKELLKKVDNDPVLEKELVFNSDTLWRVVANSVPASPIWKNRLCRTGSIWSSSLIAKLINYCSIQDILGRTRGLKNNHDDIDYAFFGIHTGHLATKDKRLIRMARMCSNKSVTTHESIFA